MTNYADQYYYSIDLLRKLVPRTVNGAAESSNDIQIWTSTKQDPAHGGNIQAMTIDVQRAMSDLSGRDRLFISDLCLYGDDFEQLGRMWSMPPTAAEAWYEGLLVEMQDFLGGETPA